METLKEIQDGCTIIIKGLINLSAPEPNEEQIEGRFIRETKEETIYLVDVSFLCGAKNDL